jgi:transcriptional regulator with XRE-family HTH domain
MANFETTQNQELIKKIGRRIFILRQNKNLSREKLAFDISISPQQLFKYEMGENRITVDRLIAIASALDLKLLDFFLASEFGEEVGNLIVVQSDEEMQLTANFSKFKKLSGEDVATKLLELLVSE